MSESQNLIAEAMGLIMFGAACVVLLSGYPVAFSLAGTALGFAAVGSLFGLFDLNLLAGLPSRYLGVMTNQVLVAVPLFVFMGVMLERARIAEQLLEAMGRMFGTMRGGLGLSVIFVGMLLAASTGIVGATVVTMGLLSLPTMLKVGYSPRLACGTICAAGTLGQIIPPSIVLVLLGDYMAGAYSQAQMQLGNWAAEPVSVIDLFAGAFIPGMLLVGLYMIWQLVLAALRPESCPPVPADAAGERTWGQAVIVLLPPVLLILLVLGSILIGAATPTEAAAVGSVGAILLAGRSLAAGPGVPAIAAAAALAILVVLGSTFDMRVQRNEIPAGDMAAIVLAVALCGVLLWGVADALWRVWRHKVLMDVMRATTEITCMVFVILLGASVFSLVFRGFGGDDFVHGLLTNLPGGLTGAMLVVMLIMFLLGFFLDFIEIVFVVVPIVVPILFVMGADPVWLGVMIAINLQTSFLTPPFGFALFYLRGVAPPGVTTLDIYRGVVPFVIIQLIGLGLVALFPALATWLPDTLF